MRSPTVRTATHNRRAIRRGLAGALAVALALGGVALARARVRTHPPAIRLSAPQSVAAGSRYTIRVSGYFNNTKQDDGTAGANFASVAETNRFVSCNYKTPQCLQAFAAMACGSGSHSWLGAGQNGETE